MNDFKFEKVEGGYSLARYTGKDNNLVIPDTFEGEPVVKIFSLVFQRNKNIVTINLPNTLLKIGSGAFGWCENLTEIVIPNSVEELGSELFKGCTSLSKVTLPNGLKILPRACFYNCTSLKTCELPASLECIEYDAFSHCEMLQEIVLPPNLKKVDINAFANCYSLQRVVCSTSSIKFQKKAFALSNDKSNLKELPYFIWSKLDLTYNQNLTLMKSIIDDFDGYSDKEKKDCIAFIKRRKKMREQFFLQGDYEVINFLLSIKITLTLDELNQFLEESIKLENTKVTALLLDYKNKTFSKELIEDFENNKELVELGFKLPNLNQFKEKWYCSKVTGGLRVSGYKGKLTEQETIPKELADGTKIVLLKPTSANDFCNIKKLIIESELTEISTKTFQNCNILEEIILPDTLKIIGDYAFSHCSNLREIKFPLGLEVISNGAFNDCASLEQVILPKSLEVIKRGAFCMCPNLGNVEYYSTTDVEEFAFKLCTQINVCVKED